jgi:sec-independent protein translocase protein TatC
MFKSAKNKAANPGGEMPLMDHLSELRRRLIICVTATFIGMGVIFAAYDPVLDFLVEPYQQVCEEGGLAARGGGEEVDCSLLQTDPLEGFNVRIMVSLYGGVALAMPVLLWQVWRFVSPGLYSNEKKHALPFVFSALTLFATGAALAYWMLPRALDFLERIGGGQLDQHYSPAKYLGLVSYMMLAFGVGFQVPVLMVFLQMVGVVQPATLRHYRRHAVVVIAFLSAVITPTGDPITMLALMVPMYLFYELAILIGAWLSRRAARARP